MHRIIEEYGKVICSGIIVAAFIGITYVLISHVQSFNGPTGSAFNMAQDATDELHNVVNDDCDIVPKR